MLTGSMKLRRVNQREPASQGNRSSDSRHGDVGLMTASWMSQDPMGYVDGMNLYEYVGSRPTVAVDPAGLEFLIGSTQYIHSEMAPGPAPVSKDKELAIITADLVGDWTANH